MSKGMTRAEAVRAFGDEAMKAQDRETVARLWRAEYQTFADRAEATRKSATTQYRRELSDRGLDRDLWGSVVVSSPRDETGAPMTELGEDLAVFEKRTNEERIEAFIARLEETAMHKDIVSRLWFAELSMHRELGHNLNWIGKIYRDAIEARNPTHPALRYLHVRERFLDLDVMVAAFVQAAVACTSQRALQELWNSEYAALRSVRKVNTLRSYLPAYRDAVDEAWRDAARSDSPHPVPIEKAIEIVAPPARDINLVNAAYTRKVVARHKGGQVLVTRWREILDRCADLVRSDDTDPYAMLMALCLLTGRRPVEVGVMGEVMPFEENGAPSPAFVRFTGQAKRKGSGDPDEEYTIPVLTDASVVIRRWNDLRENGPFGHLENREFSQASRPMTARRKVKIDPLMPAEFNFQNRHLRTLYAELCFALVGNVPEGGRWTKTGYFARILGHSSEDMETSLSYQVFELEGARPDLASSPTP